MKIEPDTWLASIFGYAVFRIVDSGQDPADFGKLLTAAISPRRNAFIFAKVPAGNAARLGAFLASGFRIVDINVVLDREPPAVPEIASHPPCTVRDARPQEAEQVSEIAGVCFTRSRFHQDPLISRSLANTIKRRWVENYFNGERGEKILVAEIEGTPAGFLAITRAADRNRTLRIIDLIGVHPDFQGRGIGTELVRAFIRTSVGSGDLLRVGTQLINIPSLHLYEQNGFRISDSAYVLHAHVREGNVIS